MKISFTVYGNPKAKKSVKVFYNKHTKRVGTYTDKDTRDYLNYIKMNAVQNKPDALLDEPLDMEIKYYLQRPKSLPKKVIYHTKKPDLDNLTKNLLDGLSGIIFRDDALIKKLVIEKHYGEPRTEITIETLGE